MAHDASHGPHIVEDFTLTRAGGFTTRGLHRTAIALPPAVAEKMSRDEAFCEEVLDFCVTRRAALEKTTVVYDPAKDLGIERLFPKWLYVNREGRQCRDAMACAMPPKHILELASLYPKGFTSTDAWRAWCDGLEPLAGVAGKSALPTTETLPPRIAALVLGNDAYFTTPEYRAWIGRAKQKKREEVISRDITEVYATPIFTTAPAAENGALLPTDTASASA